MEIEWLDDLEARIHEAAERLRALKEKNGARERRIADLEAQLAAAAPDPGWEGERAGIRRRVETLASTLEDLLEE